MTPFESAAAVYDREPCARTFEHDLFLHLMHGYVVSSPTLFAMFRPVRSAWNMEQLLDPSQTDPDGDAWWLWLVAGDPAPLFDGFPPKKLVAFERRNSPRFVAYERIRRLWRASVGHGLVSPEREAGAAP